MNIELSFLGAAQNVTGSRFLLEANGSRVLVDCGLYQEREFRERNWDPFPVPPASIDAVLLTHAHLDPMKDIDRVKTGDHNWDVETFGNRLVLSGAHHRTNMSRGEKPLHAVFWR